MPRRGFTLIEMLIVIVVIGTVVGFSVPRLRAAMVSESVWSARREVTTHLARARAAAVQRGCRATLELEPSTQRVWVTACPVSGTDLDTLGSIANLTSRYGVAFASSSDQVVFGPHGLAMGTAWTRMSFTKGGYSDTLAISPLGRADW